MIMQNSKPDITVDRNSDTPLVQQLAEELERLVREGDYAPGSKLPSEQDLVNQTGMVRRSVRDAIERVVAKGLLIKRHGVGMFVREFRYVKRDPLWAWLLEARFVEEQTLAPDQSLWREITGVDAPLDFPTEYYDLDATPDLAAAFGRDPESHLRLLCRRYLIMVDDRPHLLYKSYLPHNLVRGTDLIDKANERPNWGTVAQLRSVGVRVARGFGRIRLHHPDPTEEQLLGISPGTGAILFRRYLLNTAGAVVEVGDAIVPGDREEIWLGVDFATGQVLQKPQVLGGPEA